MKFYQTYTKPLLDFICASLGFIVLLPIFIIVIVMLFFLNQGKPFFLQQRPGKNEEIFSIIKFKTMNEKKDANGDLLPPLQRLTRIGEFVRTYSLDEIPQLLNVIKGDMSIIGPRPERPFFVKELSQFIPFYETRHTIKPGLSGWAQVNHRYGSTVEDSLIKLQYDLYYIKHRSFFLDFNIIIKTLSTVIYYRGQ